MRVVVTGGAGFIGSNLCRQLRAAGTDDVVVLDDLSTGNLANLAGIDVDFVEGSILDDAALDRCLAGAGAVVHL
ncbi:MAG: NAD-dependent epimerase/dehydratase family protein, partial [Ilumatobacteraceae bacterium]